MIVMHKAHVSQATSSVPYSLLGQERITVQLPRYVVDFISYSSAAPLAVRGDIERHVTTVPILIVERRGVRDHYRLVVGSYLDENLCESSPGAARQSFYLLRYWNLF